MTTVVLHEHVGFTEPELAFAHVMVEVLEATVNAPSFLQAVRQLPFCPAPYRPHAPILRPNGNEIARIIEEGDEINRTPNRTIDLSLRLREYPDTVLASAAPGSRWITLNREALRGWMRANRPRLAAAIVLHEWMHVAGFLHHSRDVSLTAADVAYAIEHLVLTHDSGRFRAFDARISPVRPRRVSAWSCPAVLPSIRRIRG